MSEFTVVSWNLLMDQGRVNKRLITPQIERIDSQIETLLALEQSGVALDVVGICEAEKPKLDENPTRRHNGEHMARALTGQPGHWAMHNSIKRTHRREHIGMLGRLVTSVEVVDLPFDKRAVIGRVHDVPVAMNHFRSQINGKPQAAQAEVLLEYFADESTGVIQGDFNVLPNQRARRLIRQAGFVSVFKATGQRQPATFPSTPAYWQVFKDSTWGSQLVFRPYSLDDIYVKGMDVLRAGTFIGDSDHVGLYATLSTM